MKMNKSIAGYHMLAILSEIDGNFDSSEGKIIIKYLKENFPLPVNLDSEIDLLSTLKKEDYSEHFTKAALDFYQDSTEEERNHFIDFAIKLVKADKTITTEENKFIDELCNAWDI